MRPPSVCKLGGMGRLGAAGDLDGLRGLVEQVWDLVGRDGSAEARLSPRRVLAAVARLRETPAPGDSVMALSDVCHFLRVRGGEASEREAGCRILLLSDWRMRRGCRGIWIRSRMGSRQLCCAWGVPGLPGGC